VVKKLATRYSHRARSRRALLLHERLRPSPNQRLLDLGSEDGEHIASIVPWRANVVIADIDPDALHRGQVRHGFVTLELDESGRVPTGDGEYDIVFCSSVIEHVTIEKDRVWEVRDGREFRRLALERQQEFANEIRRIGHRYFVQTPNRWFWIESHTWLPGIVVLLPRPLLLRLLRLVNRYWAKTTMPDWNLLTANDMRRLFPDATIVRERSLGLTKSLIAIRE
jgi:Methyltransferase domain